jgi:hypothetical protein
VGSHMQAAMAQSAPEPGRSGTSAIPGLVMPRITLPRHVPATSIALSGTTVDATIWLLYGGNRQVATRGGVMGFPDRIERTVIGGAGQADDREEGDNE